MWVLFFNATIQSGQRKCLGGAQVTISSLFVIPSKYESIIFLITIHAKKKAEKTKLAIKTALIKLQNHDCLDIRFKKHDYIILWNIVLVSTLHHYLILIWWCLDYRFWDYNYDHVMKKFNINSISVMTSFTSGGCWKMKEGQTADIM